MAKMMPQEIQVWFLLPALRREIAKILIKDYGFSQRKIAEILGITEAAISQYLSSKRAIDLKFSKENREKIKKAVKKIVNSTDESTKFIYSLSKDLMKSGALCDLHRMKDRSVGKNCDICRN